MAWKKRQEQSSDSSGKKGGIPRTEAPLLGVGQEELDYQIGNLQGVGARERQEDSFCIANAFDADKRERNGLFFAVCDGMGGMKDGKIASETAVSGFRSAFESMDREGDFSEELKAAVFRVSAEVEAILEGQGGSTVVAGIIYRDKLHFVSVGDSCFYLVRDGQIYRLNLEHNMCNQIYLSCIEDGVVDATDGRTDAESAALTAFLGMTGLDLTDGTVRPIPMKAWDVLLACSDGVGGTLSEQELRNALDGSDPAEMCRNLEEGILEHAKPHQDNYTAVVVKCVPKEKMR